MSNEQNKPSTRGPPPATLPPATTASTTMPASAADEAAAAADGCVPPLPHEPAHHRHEHGMVVHAAFLHSGEGDEEDYVPPVAKPAEPHSPQEISFWQDFFAGTLAGVTLTLVGHPFDTIKVRQQTQSALYRSGMHCLRETVSKEGVLALYKGMGGPMVTVPLLNAIVFAAYAQGKEWMHQLQPVRRPLNLWEISLAGAYAGFCNCIIVCPVELVKTRLQIQHEATTLRRPTKRPLDPSLVFDGPWDCVKKIIKKNGVKGLFRGMSATMYREVPGYGTQFFMYEALKRGLTREGEHVQDLGAFPLIMAGGTAGIFGWIWSYPQDYIKSQIQAEPYDKKTPYPKNPYIFDGGFISAWKQTVREAGYKGLWKGFGTCAARAWPANAAGFLAYEFGLKLVRGDGK